MTNHRLVKYLNLTLVVAFPIAWFSPLLITGLIAPWYVPVWPCENTLFEPDTLTVISGIQKLLETDILLALVVTFFALVAPLLKCLGLGFISFYRCSADFFRYFVAFQAQELIQPPRYCHNLPTCL
jgi:hypothetical protein